MNWRRYGTDFIAANEPDATTGFWGTGFKRAPGWGLSRRAYTFAAGGSSQSDVLEQQPCTAATNSTVILRCAPLRASKDGPQAPVAHPSRLQLAIQMHRELR